MSRELERLCFKTFLVIIGMGIFLSFIPAWNSSYLHTKSGYATSCSYKSAMLMSIAATIPLIFDVLADVLNRDMKFLSSSGPRTLWLSRSQFLPLLTVIGTLTPTILLATPNSFMNKTTVAAMLCAAGIQRVTIFGAYTLSCNSYEFNPDSVFLSMSAPLLQGIFVICCVLDIVSSDSKHSSDLTTISIAAKIVLMLAVVIYNARWFLYLLDSFKKRDRSKGILKYGVQFSQNAILLISLPAIGIGFSNYTETNATFTNDVLCRAAQCMTLLVLLLFILQRMQSILQLKSIEVRHGIFFLISFFFVF